MIRTITVLLRFPGDGTDTDVTSLILEGSAEFNLGIFNEDKKSVVDTCSFSLKHNSTVVGKIRAATSRITVTITNRETSAALFKGVIEPNAQQDASDYVGPVKLECVDNSWRFDNPISTSFAYPALVGGSGNKIFDPADKTHSIVHLLATMAGYSDSEIVSTGAVTTVVDYCQATKDESTYRELLDALLFEHKLVMHFNASGQLYLMSWSHETSAYDIEVNESNLSIVEPITWNKRAEYKDGVSIEWSENEVLENALVFRDNLPVDGTGQFTGQAIAAGDYYPPDSDISEIYQAFVKNWLDTDYLARVTRLKNENIALIHTSDHKITGYWTGDADVAVDLEQYESQRARIRFKNNGAGTEKIYSFEIHAKALYRTAVHKTITPDTATDTKTFTTRFIFDSTKAQSLANALSLDLTYAGYTYTFGMNSLQVPGTVAWLREPRNGTDTLAFITGVKITCGDPVFRYSAIGIATYALLDTSDLVQSPSVPILSEQDRSLLTELEAQTVAETIDECLLIRYGFDYLTEGYPDYSPGRSFLWDFDSELDDWTAYNGSYTLASGIMTFTGSASDPYIEAASGTVGSGRHVLVRARRTAGTGVAWKFKYGATEMTCNARDVGDWQIIRFYITASDTGALQFHIGNNGDTWEIDWMYIGLGQGTAKRVYDGSGAGNDGTAYMICEYGTDPDGGKCLKSFAEDCYVSFPSQTFATDSAWSMFFRMKENASGYAAYFIGRRSASPVVGIAADDRFFFRKAGGSYYYLHTELERTAWRDYLLTYNKGAIKLYRNGVLVGTATGSDTNTFSALLSAYVSGSTRYPLNGLFDEFRLYSRELSAIDAAFLHLYPQGVRRESIVLAVPPPAPYIGLRWYDTVECAWKRWNGTTWLYETMPEGPETTINTGLVARYTFDEDDGRDASGNGKNATAVSGSVSYATGKTGRALSIAGGATNYLKPPNLLLSKSAFTIVGWVKKSAYNANAAALSDYASANRNYTFCYENVDGQVQMRVGSGAADYALSARPTYSDAAFHLWAFVFKGHATDATLRRFEIWFDGKPVAARTDVTLAAVGSASSNAYDRLGNYNNLYSLNGLIDELRVYERDLTPCELVFLNLSPRGISPLATDLQLQAIASDNLITPQEKTLIVQRWCAIYGDSADPPNLNGSGITGEYPTLKALATALGIWTPTTAGTAAKAYYDATEDLRAYLFGTPGVILTANWCTNITIVKATYMGKWTAYAAAAQEMQKAIGSAAVPGVTPKYLGYFSSAPSSPNVGDWYFNTTASKMYVWDGSSWTETTQSRHFMAAMHDLLAYASTQSTVVTFLQNLVAANAFIAKLATMQIVLDDDGHIRAGYDEDGSPPPSGAGFWIGADGKLKAVEGEFSGALTASSGTFQGSLDTPLFRAIVAQDIANWTAPSPSWLGSALYSHMAALPSSQKCKASGTFNSKTVVAVERQGTYWIGVYFSDSSVGYYANDSMSYTHQGNIDPGGTGELEFAGPLKPDADGTRDIGSASKQVNDVFASGAVNCYDYSTDVIGLAGMWTSSSTTFGLKRAITAVIYTDTYGYAKLYINYGGTYRLLKMVTYPNPEIIMLNPGFYLLEFISATTAFLRCIGCFGAHDTSDIWAITP